MQIELPAHRVYIMSGAPGAGKSTVLKNSGLESMTLSSDQIRRQLLGTRREWISGEEVEHPGSTQDAAVFRLLADMLEIRCREGLTTFVDTTAVDDEARAAFVKIAEKHNMPAMVLLLDPPYPQLLEQDRHRLARVGQEVVDSFHLRLQRDSRFPLKRLESDDLIQLVPNRLPLHARIDVVGDVHGLKDELDCLLASLGYRDSGGFLQHPEGRHLLFLGDFIDRGPQSLEMLKFVFRLCVLGGHYAIMGNHERKFLRFLDGGNPSAKLPIATAETVEAFLRLPAAEQVPLLRFLRSLPSYYVLETPDVSLAMVHANLISFDPLTTPRSELEYGSQKGKTDNDTRYASGVDAWRKGNSRGNKYLLLRGHVLQTTANDAVFSLEEEQAFSGNLVALPLDSFLEQGANRQAFEVCSVRQPTMFDFAPMRQAKKELLTRISKLRTEKLLKATESEDGLTLYKYSRRVFYDGRWDRDPLLRKTRGLVLDRSLRIVQHPFDKVFNLGEQGTALTVSDSTPVVATDKLNGFLCCVTRHPYDHGQLLITTTGSFDSPFVEMARESLKPYKGDLLKILRQAEVTLMFEVLHPEDPHIIAYAEADYGPWLIGARGKDWEDSCWTEEELDGLSWGVFRRPAWKTTTLGVIKEAKKRERIEGWMVRTLEAGQPFLCKVKTDYYLTTKFIGRLSDSKIAYLFGNPSRFKQEVDEEFYGLVDDLSRSVTREQFLGLSTPERVALVRSFLD